MSTSEVRREGLAGALRPGREAEVWGRPARAGAGTRVRTDHPGATYYGQPVINPPVWEEREIAGYLFTGGLAGASSLLAAGADLTGRPYLARSAKVCATASISVSLAALIKDLGRPRRFLNMLRVLKPTSPMSVGSWLLAVYAPLSAAAAGSELLGIAPRAGRAASVGAGVLGAGVSTYTAALISNTAVPAWHDGHREMPFLFAGSAASAGAGAGLLGAPVGENAPARRMAVLGAAGELAAGYAMERRMGLAAETLSSGPAGRKVRLGQVLAGAGALGAATVARRSRVGAAVSGAALLAGSLFTRFGLFEAGVASASDPRYTVAPQRERLDARAGRG